MLKKQALGPFVKCFNAYFSRQNQQYFLYCFICYAAHCGKRVSPICSKLQRSVQDEGEEIHGFTFQKIRFTVSNRLIHEINVKI